MTVAALNAFDTGNGNGATTVFNFTFRCKSAAEVAVYLDNVLQTTGFTVTVNSDGIGGNVTFTSPPASGVKVAIVSNPLFTQLISFVNAGKFLPTSHDDANDRAAIRAIRLKFDVDRTFKVPFGETGSVLPAAADRANKIPAFDASGNIYTPNVSASDLETLAGISGNVTTVAGVAANVTTVAGSIGNVNNVGNSITNVNAVGGSIANVNTVGANMTAVNAAAQVVTGKTTAQLFIVVGQSLTDGRAPQVTAPANVVPQLTTFVGGSEVPLLNNPAPTSGSQYPVSVTNNMASMVPLVPAAGLEGLGPGIGYQAAKYSALVFYFAPGFGGTSLKQLHTGMMGTFRHSVRRAVELVKAAGYTPQVNLVVIHGHGNADNKTDGGLTTQTPTSTADYIAAMKKMVASWRAAIATALDVSTWAGPVWVTPLMTGALTGTADTPAARTEIVNAQSQFPTVIPGVKLLPPHSQFANIFANDLIHPVGQGYRYYGELIGLYPTTSLQPPKMISKSVVGSTVVVTFDQPIRLSATLVDMNTPGNSKNGFLVIDNTATTATGSVTLAANPAANDTVTINGKAVTFVAGGGTGFQVNIGAANTDTAANLAALITANPAIFNCTAAVAGNVVNLTADRVGPTGNYITLAMSSAGNSVSGSTFSGGVDGAEKTVSAVAVAGSTATLTVNNTTNLTGNWKVRNGLQSVGTFGSVGAATDRMPRTMVVGTVNVGTAQDGTVLENFSITQEI
jgi:hypothetical protein